MEQYLITITHKSETCASGGLPVADRLRGYGGAREGCIGVNPSQILHSKFDFDFLIEAYTHRALNF